MNPCPACDSWCAGLSCPNGHRFDCRNGLHFIERDDGTGFTLIEEMPDETVVFLCRRYVKDTGNPWLKPPCPALQAMEEFLRTLDTA